MYEYADLISMANEKMQEAHRFYTRAVSSERTHGANNRMAQAFERCGDEAAKSAARWFERAETFDWKRQRFSWK